MEFSQILNQKIQERGLKCNFICKEVGCSLGSLSGWKAGKQKVISRRYGERLSRLLDIPMDAIPFEK